MFHSFHTGLADIHRYEPLVRRARARWTRELLRHAYARVSTGMRRRGQQRPAATDGHARPEAT